MSIIRIFIIITAFTLQYSFVAKCQVISTVAGNGMGISGGDGGPATAAGVYDPTGVAIDHSGNIFIAEFNHHCIRKVGVAGIITTVAGTCGSFDTGYVGDGGPATAALLHGPMFIAVDDSGNLFIGDGTNARVRKINSAGMITPVAGNGIIGYSGDGGPATDAELRLYGIAVDNGGNVYIGDKMNERVRKIDTAGIIHTIAGTGVAGDSGDGGPATAALLHYPAGVTVDAKGNVFFADMANGKVRRIDTAGIITTVAGNGTIGYSGDGGPATDAQLKGLEDIAIDMAGNIYIGDVNNYRVRKVNPSGIISTIAGKDTIGYSGDGGPATAAKLGEPWGITIDCEGNIYFADPIYNRVRKISSTFHGAGIITGADTVCIGDTITLADTITGGAWYASNGHAAVAGDKVRGLVAGTDTVSYVVTNSCVTAVAIHVITVKDCPDKTGVPPLFLGPLSTLQAWPSPNRGTFTLLLHSPANEQIRVVISNDVGQKVKEFAGRSNEAVSVDIGSNSGLYFISVITGSGVFEGKVVAGK